MPAPARATPLRGSISARMPLRVLAFVAARGHDPEALCRRVGLHSTALQEEGARVPYVIAEELGDLAAEVTRDPNIGLHLAADVRETSTRAFCF
jgi:hypothetical protein